MLLKGGLQHIAVVAKIASSRKRVADIAEHAARSEAFFSAPLRPLHTLRFAASEDPLLAWRGRPVSATCVPRRKVGPISESGPVSIVKGRPVGADRGAASRVAQGAARLGTPFVARSS